jgi:hypothetical protein
MYACNDQDSTPAVTLSLSHFRAAAQDCEYSGEVIRVVGGAQPLTLRWLTGRPRVTGMAMAAAGWAATFAAVVVGGNLGRGGVMQIAFAATMITFATEQTLLSSAVTVIVDYRVPPGAARYKRLGTLTFVTCCLLGPPAGGAALGAGWTTSLLTTLAVACALASVAAHRLGRQLGSGTP